MNLIVTLLIGAVIGWLAGIVTGNGRGLIGNAIVGVIGSFLGKYLFFDVLEIGGAANAGEWSLVGVAWGVAGAIVLLAVLRLFGFGKR